MNISLTTTELYGVEPIGAPDTNNVYTAPEQLTEGLLTLSLMPRSKWQTLLNLDTIRVSASSLGPDMVTDRTLGSK